MLEEEVRDPTAVAREHGRRHGARVLDTYQHALEGYVASIPEAALYLSSHTRARPAAREYAVETDAAGTGTVSEYATGIIRLDASGY